MKPQASDATAPYGLCECRYTHHEGWPCGNGRRGPAAFEIVRGGETLRVCTCCHLSEDKPTTKLLVGPDDDLELFRRYDDLGALVIELMILEKVEKLHPVRPKC